MRPTRTLIAAASHLEPFDQGHVSSLYGLYSVLNAIQLALWPHRKLTRSQVKKLYTHGVEHLQKAGILADVLQAGIEEPDWQRLCQTLTSRFADLVDISVHCRFILRSHANLTRRNALSAVKGELRAGRPVLLTLWGSYDHVTVAVGYDRRRLILFDSSGAKWVGLSNVGLKHPSSRKIHQLTRASVVSL